MSIASGTTGYANALEVLGAKPYAAQFLKDIMGIPTSSVTMNYTPGTDVDLIVTITDAWANSNPM